MAQLTRPDSDAALRGYLLEQARDFRRLMVDTLLDSTEWAKYAWAECSKPVDALEAGKAIRISRYDLPDGHPMRPLGRITDNLVLGADNVLTEVGVAGFESRRSART